MTSETPPKDSNKPEGQEAEKKKVDIHSLRTIRPSPSKSNKVEELFTFAKENTGDTIAYIFLIIAIFAMLFDPFSMYGALIVGIIFGLYFANELAYWVHDISALIEEHGIVKMLVLAGTILALLIKVPFVFIGIGAIVTVKVFLLREEGPKH